MSYYHTMPQPARYNAHPPLAGGLKDGILFNLKQQSSTHL